VNWVLDLDIQKFFDTVEHEWLIQMVQHRVKDRKIVSLIRRWIKVGIVDSEGKRRPATCGIPQGSVISPLLANIYLHYVFDQWTNQWRGRFAKGEVIVVRYADDCVLGFRNHEDATNYRLALSQRMAKFGLTVHPKKTQLIRFGRFAAIQCAERNLGKPQTFDFLGFTHFCTKTPYGKFNVGRRTSRRRLIKRIKAIKYELRRRMHASVKDTVQWLKLVIQGHFNYFGVPGNADQLALFKD
jgi:RNA-directed DNA polymerase